MSISLILEMAVSAADGRDAVVDGSTRWSVQQLDELCSGAAAVVAETGVEHLVYIGTGGATLPLLLFTGARAGIPVAPLNYRLSREALGELIGRLTNPLVVVDDEYASVIDSSVRSMSTAELFAAASVSNFGEPAAPDGDNTAVVLFTSGTTSQPKAVELSHNNLISYVTGTVEFAAATPDDAALICVPPYHIAGVGAAMTNLYAGRRAVYLRQFDAASWIDLVQAEQVTTATVVPTMLERIVALLRKRPSALPSLRNLAYGGSKVPLPLVREALTLLPEVGFVNAYGLTETSSTVTVLSPEDHRKASVSDDPDVIARLASVGRPVPGMEVEVRGENGEVLGPNEIGELFVRGPQVAGKYREIGSVLDDNGWFPTRDRASIDGEGYLYLGGRTDDTIIRGGENIAPAEIEVVMVEHPAVRDVAVVGVEDPHWGQIIVAVVVPAEDATPDAEELREYVRSNLRGSRTPDIVLFRAELPTTPTGKVIRRSIVADIERDRASVSPA